MNLTEAHNILNDKGGSSISWPEHCRQVAKVAKIIAEKVYSEGVDLDVGLCERQALLHDIGRSKTHGPLHGWTGFILLKNMGHLDEARGCLSHWIKGRNYEEMLQEPLWKKSLIDYVFGVYKKKPWGISDAIISFADSSVCHTSIVSIKERHQDLIKRYGDSAWLRRAAELAQIHADEISAIIKSPVSNLIEPLYTS